VSCATPDCQYCHEEAEAAAADDMVIAAVCGDEFDPGDGVVSCILSRGHEGNHTDGGDAWYPEPARVG
jgi:hypothetical protein